MRNNQRSRLYIPHVLAAAALVIGTTAMSGECLARGGGGGGGGGYHGSAMSAPGMAPRSISPMTPSAPAPGSSMPTVHLPGMTTAPTSTPQNFRHDQHGGDHHHQQPPPSSGGSTGNASTSGTVISPSSGPAQGVVLPNVAPTSVTPEIAVAPDSNQTPAAPQVATSGGTLAPVGTGGGGETLAACMELWDSSTHMTTGEWRSTCVRTLNGMDIGGGVTDFASTNPSAQQASSGTQSRTTARVIRQRPRTNSDQ